MCGRFFFNTTDEELEFYLPELTLPEVLPRRYNIAPTQPVPVVSNTQVQRVQLFRWGLIPAWAKDEGIGSRLINARAETLCDKPAFRVAYQRRRCVVLASGFYEWAVQSGSRVKIPYAFRLCSGAPMLFAGLWEVWQPTEGDPIHSCTIITTEANALLAPLHDRMPVLLEKEALERWLDLHVLPPRAVDTVLKPYPAELMFATPVSTRVNKVGYDAPDCLESQTTLFN